MKKRSRQQNPTPSPAQPPWLETQLQPLSSQANPNQDQTPPLSLDDDKKLKSTNLSQTPSLARKKTESNALAEAAQQDTQRSLEDNGASSAATDSITRQRPRLLPWRNSAVANDYHEEFVEYLATHHLPYCSIYRHSGKQPTKGDAKNWILDREAKGELARIENKWEDYQARKVNCNTQTLPTERELTIWEQQMRLQYEQERSLSTQPQKELSRQELLAELEASKTKRRNRGWL